MQLTPLPMIPSSAVNPGANVYCSHAEPTYIVHTLAGSYPPHQGATPNSYFSNNNGAIGAGVYTATFPSLPDTSSTRHPWS